MRYVLYKNCSGHTVENGLKRDNMDVETLCGEALQVSRWKSNGVSGSERLTTRRITGRIWLRTVGR